MTNTLFDLTGRTALVTGAAGGIGAGIAEVLAEAGAHVVIADIDEEKAAGQARRLVEAGHKAASIRVDLADERSVVAACEAVVADYGTPWVLVNNAGLMGRALLLDMKADDWDRVHAVNARGPFLMTREIGRAMVAAGHGGRIVNIASASVIGAITDGHAAYASSKTALIGLARTSAFELAEHGITVNTVLPGGVLTEGAMAATAGPAPTGPALREPLLAMSEPHDIAGAVLYFASPIGRNVTNQFIAVDGGWHLS